MNYQVIQKIQKLVLASRYILLLDPAMGSPSIISSTSVSTVYIFNEKYNCETEIILGFPHCTISLPSYPNTPFNS